MIDLVSADRERPCAREATIADRHGRPRRVQPGALGDLVALLDRDLARARARAQAGPSR